MDEKCHGGDCQIVGVCVFSNRRAAKNRAGGKGKSRDWKTGESRDRNVEKRPAHGVKHAQGRGKNDIPSRDKASGKIGIGRAGF